MSTAQKQTSVVGVGTREISYAEAIAEALRTEMRLDPRVFVMGEDVGNFGGLFGGTKGLLDEFGPERVRDTPISEAALIGAGVGAAITGMRPMVEIQFMDFTACAMDQIVNQAAKIRFMLGGKAGSRWSSGHRTAAASNWPRSTLRAWRRGSRTFPVCSSPSPRRRPTPRASW